MKTAKFRIVQGHNLAVQPNSNAPAAVARAGANAKPSVLATLAAWLNEDI